MKKRIIIIQTKGYYPTALIDIATQKAGFLTRTSINNGLKNVEIIKGATASIVKLLEKESQITVHKTIASVNEAYTLATEWVNNYWEELDFNKGLINQSERKYNPLNEFVCN